MGGLSVIAPPARDTASPQHRRARRAFLVSNYLILGCASGCGFLTLSLRLVPSVDGFLLILLHALTVGAAVAGCAVIAAPDPPRGRCYTAHMSATVVVSILQGAAAVLAFSRTADFLSDGLKSYVRKEDGAVILRMVGGLGVGIFCLEWVALALAFVLRYYSYVDRECGGNPLRRSAKVGGEDGAGTWPWPFQCPSGILFHVPETDEVASTPSDAWEKNQGDLLIADHRYGDPFFVDKVKTVTAISP
ncbi:uncharacterized protein C2845_PM15G13030 [Panicum miliaceum]|uniref:Uncharacterized protein n=1 Tax=Panicum miliaceum TaxID=4540 RepID=A0A3L6Q4E5_PANMI|nr:uncharacterized protein C2845_PM15G13030 [Panicum miliaceum]